MSSSVQSIPDLLQRAARRWGPAIAMRHRKNLDRWGILTWSEVAHQTAEICAGLVDMGLRYGIPTMAVGQITEPRQAEAILRSGQADMVALARGMLFNPRWAWHAAEVLDAEAAYPPQYMRTNRALRGAPIPGNPPTQAK